MRDLSIGDMAVASGLTVKRLRHYHDEGVLPAAHVDLHSGHRRYSSAQVEDAVLVRRLRSCGMSLATIAEVLALPREHRAARVHDELESLRARLAADRHDLDLVTSLLQIVPEVAFAVRTLSTSNVLAATAELSRDECPAWFDRTYPELISRLPAGVVPGTVGATYGRAFFDSDRGPVRAFIEVPAATPGEEPLPGGTFALAVHDGSYERFDRTYAGLGAALASSPYVGADADVREHYVVGPAETPDPTRWRSEICWPVHTQEETP